MPIKQDDRMLGIKTALGAATLALGAFRLQEQIGRLFQVEAELATEDGEINLDDVIGQKATIRLNIGDNDQRYFNGYVNRLMQVANEGHYARYRATIVPWLWFLTRTSDCRIFQEKTAPQIIEEVFSDRGFNDYQLKLSTTYPKREYCVQYRETDFNFVSRLMEQEGIYYYFEHEDGKHTLVLADSISAQKPFPGYGEVEFHELQDGGAQTREVLTGWTMQKEVKAVACALTDFDFKNPRASLRVSSNVSRQHGKAEYEVYDYPGEYRGTSEGDRLAEVRLNELQTQYEVLHGEASARGLAAGCTFKLTRHPRGDQNRDYLITQVSIEADSGPFDSTSGEESFSCTLSAIDKSQQFRPERLTPEPVIQGPQTAIVVGPAGEKIHTDAYGRVKVQFHWDRRGKKDENSSCWMRVSQAWAGKQWGDMAIPHVGDEVIVECLEGDPDRPIITGRVFNQATMPPFRLPAHKHKRVWTDDYGNRLVFDATPGDEHIRMHSPHHKSMLSLGRSNTMFAVENFIQGNLGLNIQCVVGAAIQNYLGGYLQSIEGTNISWTIGDFWQAVLGPSSQVFLGPQFNYNKGYQYQQYDGDLMKVSKQNVVISSGTIANLVGGASSAAGTTNLYSDGTVLELSAGAKLDVGTAADPSVPPLVWELVALPAVAALLAGLTAAGNGLVDSDDNSLSGSSKDWQAGLVGGAVGAEAVGIVMTICTLSQLSVEAFQARPVKHLPGQAKALLQLCTNGMVVLSGEKIYTQGPQNSGSLYLDNGRSELWHQTQASICSAPPGPVSPNYVVAEAAGQVRIGAQTQVTIAAPSIDIGSGALTIMAGVPGPMQMISALEAKLAALQNDVANTANYVRGVAAQEARLAADVAKLMKLPLPP